MSDTEHELQHLPRRRPSASLDDRMDALFERAGRRHRGVLTTPVPAWLLAVACAACVVVGVGMRTLWERPAPRTPAPVIVVLPPSEELRQVLNRERMPTAAPAVIDFTRAPVRITTKPVPTDGSI
jgi:hypothetical protein